MYESLFPNSHFDWLPNDRKKMIEEAAKNWQKVNKKEDEQTNDLTFTTVELS
jgi:TRAP-type C4-dicarboxylate transport system substrate-binding protein